MASLPFSGGSTNVNSNEANVQPMGVFENVTDQPITDMDVHDVLDEERAKNEQARGMPKWLVHTLRDSKLDAPLSSRTRSASRHASYASDCYALVVSSLHDVGEPLSFDEAQNLENWMAAMQSEFDALIENDTWTLCDLPPGKKAIGTKWVYKLKRKPDGEIDRYKARLVAKGYAQQKGIDYEETFAPTCCMTTMHFLCALAAHFGWDVHQSDIVIAFLNGDIFEEVYVTQPRGFVKKGQEDKVCKCHKALYGLKQSPRAWYEKADTHLVKRGFCNSPTESTLYVRREGDVLLIVVLYVDDLLITGPNEGHIVEFKADLNATFKMKDLGLLHHYLDIQFKQCDGDGCYSEEEGLAIVPEIAMYEDQVIAGFEDQSTTQVDEESPQDRVLDTDRFMKEELQVEESKGVGQSSPIEHVKESQGVPLVEVACEH
ncbi:hypothetical protein L7F22_064272 [Adiantum nelumboides]|nr:hypothetical protein [Adiantum nelumboides]